MYIGIINPKCVGLIGSGIVTHIPSFFAELDALEAQGKLIPKLLLDEVSDIRYRPELY